MTIVTSGDKYYIPVANGFQEISKAVAMDLYEQDAVDHEEVIEYD